MHPGRRANGLRTFGHLARSVDDRPDYRLCCIRFSPSQSAINCSLMLDRLSDHPPPFLLHLDAFSEDPILRIQQPLLPLSIRSLPGFDPCSWLRHLHHHVPQFIAFLGSFPRVGIGANRFSWTSCGRSVGETAEHGGPEDDSRRGLRWDDDWHLEDGGKEAHEHIVLGLRP